MLQCTGHALTRRDLLGLEFEVRLNVRSRQQENGHGTSAKLVIQRLATTREPAHSAQAQADNQ